MRVFRSLMAVTAILILAGCGATGPQETFPGLEEVSVEVPGVSLPDEAVPSTTEQASPSTEATTTTVKPLPEGGGKRTKEEADTTPLPEDPSGEVEVVTGDNGESIALGPTNVYLASGTFACGGKKDAPYLADPTLFTGEDLLEAYKARPTYAANDMKFWEGYFGNEVFYWMIDSALGNEKFDQVIDQAKPHEVFSAKLFAATPEVTEVKENFTCKGDVIRRNGFLAIGEEGRFLSYAGLVVNAADLDAMLQKHGMSRADLRVGILDVVESGKKTGYVFVEFKAVGCLNNLLIPENPPKVPGKSEPPSTTAPPVTQPPVSTTVPPGTTVPPVTTVPPATTVPPGTTVPPTTTHPPQTTVPPSTNPPTTTVPCLPPKVLKAGKCETPPPSPPIPPVTTSGTTTTTIGPSTTAPPSPTPTGPITTVDPPTPTVPKNTGGTVIPGNTLPPTTAPLPTNPPATIPPGQVGSD